LLAAEADVMICTIADGPGNLFRDLNSSEFHSGYVSNDLFHHLNANKWQKGHLYSLSETIGRPLRSTATDLLYFPQPLHSDTSCGIEFMENEQTCSTSHSRGIEGAENGWSQLRFSAFPSRY